MSISCAKSVRSGLRIIEVQVGELWVSSCYFFPGPSTAGHVRMISSGQAGSTKRLFRIPHGQIEDVRVLSCSCKHCGILETSNAR